MSGLRQPTGTITSQGLSFSVATTGPYASTLTFTGALRADGTLGGGASMNGDEPVPWYASRPK